jgi:hypothetical protein
MEYKKSLIPNTLIWIGFQEAWRRLAGLNAAERQEIAMAVFSLLPLLMPAVTRPRQKSRK